MKYFGLVWAGLRRKPLRTGFTALSLVFAFLLFGLLEPVVQIFDSGLGQGVVSRFFVSPRGSISDMLPVNYMHKVAQVKGVAKVAHQTWFGGLYKDPAVSNTFTRWAVPAEQFMALYPELVLSEEQLAAFISTRTGVIVGQDIATRFDLKVGNKISLLADIWHNQDGSMWEFDLVGIYTGADDSVSTTRLFMNYDYFDEYRVVGKGIISNVLFSVEDSLQGDAVIKTVDALFANSFMETKTQSEQEYVLSFIKQLGNIGLIIRAIMGAVFFTLLLLTANTMSQAARDRIPELAVLKTLGFQNTTLLLLVLAETILLIGLAAILGMCVANYMLQFGDQLLPQFGSLELSLVSFLTGLLVALLLAALVGLPPAIKAMKLNIVDALQRL